MPDLTRLRRYIRGYSGWHGDIETLLDAIDEVMEGLEVTERDLSNYNSLEEDTANALVLQHCKALIETIAKIDLRHVLSVLVENYDFSLIVNMLAEFQPNEESKHEDSLGDLDDHPF